MESGFQRVAGWCEAADDFMELASELCRRRSRKLFCVGGSGSSPLWDVKAQNICMKEGRGF